MLMVLSAAFALQVQIQVGDSRRNRPTVVRDSTDSSMTARRRSPRRLPVTAEVLRTAYRDTSARSLLLHARAARLTQDSALDSYAAQTYQRISAGLGFTRIGRDRLIFRTENSSRVQWKRGVGAWIDITGHRTALPGIPKEGQEDAEQDMRGELHDMTPIPYYPGYEPLWIGSGIAKTQVDERELVHPIADGAEAYYTYQTGDSVSFRLPDGKVVQLRELRVRPRQPRWNVAVGSLWFDTKSGQLVRAAYRMAVPLDVWTMVREEDSTATDDIPKWVMPLISPIEAQVSAIAVEYGLYEGRFWLPRLQAAEGDAKVSFMRVPFKMEQSFRYSSVNGIDSLPKVPLAPPGPRLDTLPDSLRTVIRDSLRVVRRARRDSIRTGLIKDTTRCADGVETALQLERRYESSLQVAYRIPCNVEKLAKSPDLPASIFDPADELFDAKARQALVDEALSLTAQPQLLLYSGHLPKPAIKYGAEFMRYNRVEGFSAGVLVDENLGGGYSVRALGRLGLADLQPNIEVTGVRDNMRKAIRVGGYTKLVSASDWGNPLSFGSSLSNLLWARDEGFYYYATGAELGWTRASAAFGGARWDGRLFVERERAASQKTDISLGGDFIPNIKATTGTFSGGALRVEHNHGLDPQGFRTMTDVRLEAAYGADSGYGRAAADFTAIQGIGSMAAAITLSGGSSVGALPLQRSWFLGGSHTIRGIAPDTARHGNAFWMGRAELGTSVSGVRPIVFSDIGWVGDRTKMSQIGVPMSGAGVGASFMDGLFRFDVARGINPVKTWRVDLYVEAKF
jgi:hypothetical protein